MAQVSPIIPLPFSGSTKFSPVHASDCAEAIVRLLKIENSIAHWSLIIETWRLELENWRLEIEHRKLNIELGIVN